MEKFDNPRLKQPLLNKWIVDKFIGSGQYGKVYRVHSRNDEIAAVKIISMPNDDIRQACEAQYGSDDELEEFITELVQKFTNEVDSMRTLRRETKNIIEIYDNRALQSGIHWDVLIVMEYATPLKNYISQNGMTVEQALRLARDIASALAVCEKKNIIHRDIKDDNIFVGRDGLYKIGDFGVANMAANQEHHTRGIGTFNYMAPEVHAGGEYTTSVDLYSLGIVLYKLFNGGRLPFVSQTVRGQEANRMRMNGEKIPAPENAPHEFAQIILKCCEYNPEDRYKSAKELIADLDMMRSGMSAYDLAQEIPVKRRVVTGGTSANGSEDNRTVNKTMGNTTEGRSVSREDSGSGTSKTVQAWETYNPTLNGNATGRTVSIEDDGNHTVGMNVNTQGMKTGNTMTLSNNNTSDSNTVNIIKEYIDAHGPNSPILKKLMEKNKLLEDEKQEILREKHRNKVKKTIISILAGVVVASLICVLLVIIFSTSYFANEGDYHRIYSRSIVSGEKLFDSSEVAYLSEDDGYLYFSEVTYQQEQVSTYKLYRMNIRTKEKSLICEDSCHFDVVIGDYVYFTSGPKGAEYLYRIPKDGSGQKKLLLEASCYDLSADGKTLVFKTLDMNGQERKINTNKIEEE